MATADAAYLGEENAISFWRGIDPQVARTEAFLGRARCGPEHGDFLYARDGRGGTTTYLDEGSATDPGP